MGDFLALITGGSSGIGLALARRLAMQGASLILVARDPANLRSAVSEIEKIDRPPSSQVSAIPADVANPEQVMQMVSQVVAQHGTPGLVIHSAGVVHPGYFEEITLEQFHWMMDINFFGAVHLTKAVLPYLTAQHGGHLVFISSLAGILNPFGYTAYGASKYALRGFAEALRQEVKPKGIDVSIVFPPDTDTPQLAYDRQFQPPETRAINGNAGCLSPDQVAVEVLQGVRRKKFGIFPGTQSKVIHLLVRLLGESGYPILDHIISGAQKGNSK